MKIFLTTLIIALSLTVNAQKLLPESTTIPCCDNKYHLSNEPITNREYITYLNWLECVYNSFPLLNKQIYEALPGILSDDINKDFKNSNDFIYHVTVNFPNAKLSSFEGKTVRNKLIESNNKAVTTKDFKWPYTYFEGDGKKQVYKLHKSLYLENATNYVKDYMFNPKYLDYPVVGLSQLQALKYLKWLSDRYNESQLFDKKLLHFDSNQIGENCFVTEAYLAEQYAGIPSEKHPEHNLKWNSGLFLPSFRLPSAYELNKRDDKIEFKEYKKDKLKFLKPWLFELNMKREEYKITYSEYNIEIGLNLFSSFNKEFELDYFEKEILTLNSPNNQDEENYLNLLADLGYPLISIKKFLDSEGYEIEKNADGNMWYTIIDADESGTLTYIDNFKTQEFFEASKDKGWKYRNEYFKLPLKHEINDDLRPVKFVFTTILNN
jgi:hypothetical protein